MAYISFQPKDYFNTVLYTGTGSTQNITGVGFQPDWVWNKARNASEDHSTIDAVRGVTKSIYPSDPAAEQTLSTGLTAFGSDGYTVGGDGYWGYNGRTYASWNWKANGQGSSNTDGSINTTYTSANTTSGFSISQYTGAGSTSTVGHGLGVAPKVIIIKCTSNASTPWEFYHESIGNNKKLNLNSTAAEASSGYMNNTSPTSSVFTVVDDADIGGSGRTYIAYCFAPVKGFSAMGSYTGNGNADGAFIYTGFKPAFVLAKRTNAVESWVMFDNKRDPHNVVGHILHPNNNTVESDQTGGTLYVMDFLSNGFKLKGTDTLVNGSGSTYIYMAFAEAPLVSSNGVPAVAR
jgi:hypothetical protein